MMEELPHIETAQEFLRAELLAGLQGEHYAFHVACGGRVLMARSEAFYKALFAGIYDFWEMVAVICYPNVDAFADVVKRIDAADREGRFTRIYCRCGTTYLDTVFPYYISYPYLIYPCEIATAHEFKKIVEEAKAKAGE